MKKTKNEHLVPEIVKNLANRANPNNKISSANEKFQAESTLQAIIDYCKEALNK